MPAGTRQDLRRLLPALACPCCAAPLRRLHERLVCTEQHSFAVNPQGVPSLLVQREPAGRGISEEAAAAHAALHAFAGPALGRGEAEGLYRTVSELLLRAEQTTAVRWVLDLGCGPGRTLVDAAQALPRAAVVGVDRSAGALTIAFAFARLTGAAVQVDLERWGFGIQMLPAYGLRNALLIQAEAERLPFAISDRWRGFDAVTCVNLLDRTRDPIETLRQIGRVTRPGAPLILTTPMNWRDPAGGLWDALGSLNSLSRVIEEAGFRVELAFDGLVYREILDARGSATDWRVAVVGARRAG